MKTRRSRFNSEVGKVIKHSLTLNDNQTYDPGTIAFVLSILVTCYLAFHSTVFQGKDPHLQDLGVALGAIVAAFGAYKKFDPDPTSIPVKSSDPVGGGVSLEPDERAGASTSKFARTDNKDGKL